MTQLVKHEPNGNALSPLVEELQERSINIDDHFAVLVESNGTAALAAWKIGAELLQIKTKGLYKQDWDGVWADWVAHRFKFMPRWAHTCMKFHQEVDTKQIHSFSKLSMVEWHELYTQARQLPTGKRGEVIEAAAEQIHAARIEEEENPEVLRQAKRKNKNEKIGTRIKTRAKKTIEKVAAEKGVKLEKLESPKKKGRRAPDPDTVPVPNVELGPHEVPEFGAIPLENPKTNQIWMRMPKSPNGSQFRWMLGKHQVLFTINDNHVEFRISKRSRA